MMQTVDVKSEKKKDPYYVYPVMDVNLPITCQEGSWSHYTSCNGSSMKMSALLSSSWKDK